MAVGHYSGTGYMERWCIGDLKDSLGPEMHLWWCIHLWLALQSFDIISSEHESRTG